jgi:hypothetical protein
MKREEIKEYVFFVLYVGSFLALFGGLTYNIFRNHKKEQKEIKLIKKDNLKKHLLLNFNNVKQK